MLVTPPFGACSTIALWRAMSKPPVKLVVAHLPYVTVEAVETPDVELTEEEFQLLEERLNRCQVYGHRGFSR